MSVKDELKENQEIIYKELPLPEESEAELKQNMQLFCDNLELIVGNAQTNGTQDNRMAF